MTAIDITVPQEDIESDPFTSAGKPGFAVYGGYIVEQEKDTRLQGAKKYVTYNDILANVSIVASGVRFFVNLISKAGWKFDPVDQSPEAARIAEAVDSIVNGAETPWHRIVRRACMFRFYGFSLQHWTAVRRDDGMIGFEDIEPRPQDTIERWVTDENGKVLGVYQRDPQTQKEHYLDRMRMVYMVDDTLTTLPTGMGLFRHLVKDAHKLERYEILEGWGFERDLRGTPIGRAPLSDLARAAKSENSKVTDASAQSAIKPVKGFIQNALRGKDTGVVLDSSVYRGKDENGTPSTVRQWDVELMQGGTNSQPEMAMAIERINRQMARVMGVEHLLLGSDSKGSHALAKDKTQSFGLLVSGTLLEIKEQFEKDLINTLFDLNGWDRKYVPEITVEQVNYRDVEQITGALADMSQAGAMLDPDDPAVESVRELLGLPKPLPSAAIDDENLALGDENDKEKTVDAQDVKNSPNDDGAED